MRIFWFHFNASTLFCVHPAAIAMRCAGHGFGAGNNALSEKTGGAWSLLAQPLLYEALQYAVGAKRFLRMFLSKYVRVVANERMLDVGCGPAEIVRFLPDVQYVGFDHSGLYVERARRTFGARAQFIQDDVSNLSAYNLPPFDVATAIGLLHHIDDAQVTKVMSAVYAALRPGGRFVTADPCWHKGQSALKRFIIGLDRGRNVRRLEDYEDLARQVFPQTRRHLVTAHLPFPHSVAIIECARPPEAPLQPGRARP